MDQVTKSDVVEARSRVRKAIEAYTAATVAGTGNADAWEEVKVAERESFDLASRLDAQERNA